MAIFAKGFFCQAMVVCSMISLRISQANSTISRFLIMAGIPAVIDGETNKLRPIGPSSFRTWIENPRFGNLICQGRVGSGDKAFTQDKTMSEEVSRGVLASHRFRSGIRKISRVNTVRLPTKREDGAIELLPEGYDPESKIFTVTTADYQEDMDLESAKKNLEFMLSDTAFNPSDKDRSLAATLAMMLAPFCDSMFGRFVCRPSWIVQANQEGAGKTTLIRMALAPIFGPVKLTPPPARGSEDKLIELLNSVVQSGAPYLAFDNWTGKIDSGALAAFITANALSARVLGTSCMFDAEKHCLVFISVIRANVTGELRRRSLFIDLFVEAAKAEDRVIRRPIDEGDILDWRSDILASLWALVRNWHDGGCKPGSVRNASFDEWGKTIGGIVESAGYQSPLEPPPTPLDDELAAFSQFVGAVWKETGEGAKLTFAFNELLTIARTDGCFEFIAQDEPTGDDASKRLAKERSMLGKQFRKFAGRTFTLGADTKINFSLIGSGHSREYKFTKKE